MTTDFEKQRIAQDNFHSMVGETGPHPNDPQHPDPGFDVDAKQEESEAESCPKGN